MEIKYADLYWDQDGEAHQEYIRQLAPIVLFVYNRLEHTKETIEALKNNVYASESELYIYADGAKNAVAAEAVHRVREYLDTVSGFKSVKIIKRDKNWGLTNNIIDGVSHIVNQYGKVIVLEDDIVTSRYFLKYMNDALKIYADMPEVVSINGYLQPIDSTGLPQTFFVKMGGCWGWATWKNRWQHFSRSPETIIKSFTRDDAYFFDLGSKRNNIFKRFIQKYVLPRKSIFYEQLVMNYTGRLYTWAIFWCVVVFRHGYSLNPKVSMSINCGFDNSGEHCGATTFYDVPLSDEPVRLFPLDIAENEEAYERIGQSLRSFDDRSIFRMALHWAKVKIFGDIPARELVRKWKEKF